MASFFRPSQQYQNQNQDSNILKQIFPNLINTSKDGQQAPLSSLVNIENFLKKNKLFLIFFYSSQFTECFNNNNNTNNFIFSFFSLFSSLEDSLSSQIKIIICFCDDNIIDYKNSLNDISSNSSCFSYIKIPFENFDTKNKLIDIYNIISIPCVLVLDSEGNIIDSILGEKNIENDINMHKINSWINLIKIKEIEMKKRKGGYEIGDIAYVRCHRHEMVFVDYRGKEKGYWEGRWHCDYCEKSFNKDIPNFYCGLCGYDLCTECYEKNK